MVAVKVYPLQFASNGLPLAGLSGVPNVTTEVESKKEADALVATGHFTLNPNDSGRVPATEAAPEPTPAAPAADKTKE